MNRVVFLIALSSIVVFVGCASMKPMDNLLSLNGMIYDMDNRPVTDVSVTINGKYVTTTDINGHFSVLEVKLGQSYDYLFEKKNYEVVHTQIKYSDFSQIVYIHFASNDQLLSAAENCLQNKDWENTEAFLARAENSDGNKTSIAYLRASLAFSRKDYQAAYAIIRELIAAGTDDPYVLLFAADLLQYHLDDDKGAAVYLAKFLDARYDPDIEFRLKELNNPKN